MSQRSYGFLITKRADFLASKFWILFYFAASLKDETSFHYACNQFINLETVT